VADVKLGDDFLTADKLWSHEHQPNPDALLSSELDGLLANHRLFKMGHVPVLNPVQLSIGMAVLNRFLRLGCLEFDPESPQRIEGVGCEICEILPLRKL
jgi:hypothetical protein